MTAAPERGLDEVGHNHEDYGNGNGNGNGRRDERWKSLAQLLLAIVIGSVGTVEYIVWSRLDKMTDRLDRLETRVEHDLTRGDAADEESRRDREELRRRLNAMEEVHRGERYRRSPF